MRVTYNDGGRAASGFRGSADDCATRAIAIATGRPYLDVYRDLAEMIGEWRSTSRSRHAKRWQTRTATPRNGAPMPVIRRYLDEIGWEWTPTMTIGTGTLIHLREDELPAGELVVRCSRHLVAVIDGVIHDTSDPSRGGTRAVYGFWSEPRSLIHLQIRD